MLNSQIKSGIGHTNMAAGALLERVSPKIDNYFQGAPITPQVKDSSIGNLYGVLMQS